MGKPCYNDRAMADEKPIPAEWLAEFEAAARRPLAQRWKYAFIKTYKPVMDDARFRSFDSMEAYRRWCEANLPRWLGYHRVEAGRV
jgi:hypothetical protein